VDETELRARFSNVFNDDRKPMKIGIHLDWGFPLNHPAMRRWCAHPQYLRNMFAGGPRYDLLGVPSGTVASGEAEYAHGALIWVRHHLATKEAPGVSKSERGRELRRAEPNLPKLPKLPKQRANSLSRPWKSRNLIPAVSGQ
jgi:sRNA-binding protein